MKITLSQAFKEYKLKELRQMHANLLAMFVGVENEDKRPITLFQALMEAQLELVRRKDNKYLDAVNEVLTKTEPNGTI